MQSKGLSRVFSNTTVQKHQFFGAQPFSNKCLLSVESGSKCVQVSGERQSPHHSHVQPRMRSAFPVTPPRVHHTPQGRVSISKPQALRHTPKLSLITPIIPLSSLPAQWGLPTAPKSGLHYICSTLDVITIAPSPQNSKTFERKDNLILD